MAETDTSTLGSELPVRPNESSGAGSVLGPTLVMKGHLSAGEGLVIHGEIQGDVYGTETVTITKSARLQGQISAARIQFESGTNLKGVVLEGRIAQTARS